MVKAQKEKKSDKYTTHTKRRREEKEEGRIALYNNYNRDNSK